MPEANNPRRKRQKPDSLTPPTLPPSLAKIERARAKQEWEQEKWAAKFSNETRPLPPALRAEIERSAAKFMRERELKTMPSNDELDFEALRVAQRLIQRLRRGSSAEGMYA